VCGGLHFAARVFGFETRPRSEYKWTLFIAF
jgi:hypothetical protein